MHHMDNKVFVSLTINQWSLSMSQNKTEDVVWGVCMHSYGGCRSFEVLESIGDGFMKIPKSHSNT